MAFLCTNILNIVVLLDNTLNVLRWICIFKDDKEVIMSTFVTMKTTVREEAKIPMLAVHAFHQAFKHASNTHETVVYAENNQLLKKLENGDVIVLKGLQNAYTTPTLKHDVLIRKRKSIAMA